MKTLKRNQLLAAAALAAATFTAPAIAHAGNYNSYNADYEHCKKKDTEAQIVGGILGAIAGGVFGSNVAAGDVQDEGTALGAAAGAAAGIAIANKDCKKRAGYSDHSYRTPVRTPVRTSNYNRGYRTVSHNTHRGYNRHHGHNNYSYGGYQSRRQVRARIEQLKDEDRRLKRRAKYEYAPWIDRRRDEIRYEVKRLKKIEDRIEDRRDYRRDVHRDYRRDQYGRTPHYHGSNACYVTH